MRRRTFVRRGAGTVHILSRFGDRTICGKLVERIATSTALLPGGSRPWVKVTEPLRPSGVCQNCHCMRQAETA